MEDNNYDKIIKKLKEKIDQKGIKTLLELNIFLENNDCETMPDFNLRLEGLGWKECDLVEQYVKIPDFTETERTFKKVIFDIYDEDKEIRQRVTCYCYGKKHPYTAMTIEYQCRKKFWKRIFSFNKYQTLIKNYYIKIENKEEYDNWLREKQI